MSNKYYDVKRGEIVQSHGKYYEVVSLRHENTSYDTYNQAYDAMSYGKYKDDPSAIIVRQEY